MTSVPEPRLRPGNAEDRHTEGDYVLYWMTAHRRLGWNFALQHAADLARELGKPLVILELLKVDYPFASPRLHRFLLQGMKERSLALEGSPVLHHPFVERAPGEGEGLVAALAKRAVSVVADDFPSFFLPALMEETGRKLGVLLELVDSNGLLPLRATDRTFTTAYSLRRFLQKHLPDHLPEAPDPDPLGRDLPPAAGSLPPGVEERWPRTEGALLEGREGALRSLPLDFSVPSGPLEGGTSPARRALPRFLGDALERYHRDRNHPDLEATSGLSPWLHFGNLSTHEIFLEVTRWEGWSPLRLSGQHDGSREGWWGMNPGTEAFLDQLVTWRELGFNTASHLPGHTRYESLPDWSRATLEEHEEDPRPHLYALDELREAGTDDPLWNAAQRQLREEGVIHNYLRMLWGKRILEWTPTAREALDVMVELNDRLALDGRDPNSYSGIFWCLGRYDRGWPERAVFGKVRSMTSTSTRRKVQLDKYMTRFASSEG